MLAELKAEFGPASSGSVTRYLVNAGPLGADSWYRNEGEGSRFTGEGGHFLDTLSWWADSLPEEVYAVGGGPDPDDVQVTVRFANGASGVISYLTGGNARYPKETLDATGGGRSARLDNFRKATVWSGRGHETIRARAARTRASGPSWPRSSTPCVAGAADADPARVAGRHHPGHDRGAGQPAERQAGAGVSAAATVAARLVRPPGGPDVPGRGGLASAGTRLVRLAWSRAAGHGRTRPRPPCRPSPVIGASPPSLPPGTADAGARGRPEAAVLDGADRLLRGRMGSARRAPGPTWCSPTGSSTR